ncbi:MAG: T9SS type A sorting domain-containing protein, partial [Cytophagaceae bacterium]
VCTIQWKNVSDKSGTTSLSQYANFTFQVKLYETSNRVEFVYNAPTASANTGAVRFPTVGIKGSGSASGQDVLANKTASTAAWSTTVFITGVYGTTTHNFRSTVGPDAGRTYRFDTAAANDAAVTGIYTYGKLATPAALPHAVQAVVSNAGSAAQTNLVVTLSVTGANTFTDTKTVASLAAGASTTVTFASYPAALTVGTNTVTVSVPADGNTANNTATYSQQVTTNRVTYINPAGTYNATGVGVGQAGGALVAKYTLPATAVLSDVALTFAASAGNVSNYQVVLYDANGTGGVPGAVLYTSATQTRTAAAGTTTVTVPSVQVPASFYIGVKELDTNPALAYQVEDPLKPATYYYSLDAATGWTSINTTTLRTRLAIEFGTVTAACASPTAVAVGSITATSASVSFTPATSGVTSYQVVYGPVGFDPTMTGTTIPATASPVVITGLTPSTPYQVYVRSVCTAGSFSPFTSVVNFTTSCDPNSTVAAFPYSQNFDVVQSGQSLPCGITTLDANNDGAVWRINASNPSSTPNAMRYTSAITNSQAANDWFFTPGLVTTAGTRYQVAFRYRAEGIAPTPSNFTEGLEVKYGTGRTAATQTTTLFTNTAITNTSYALANGASAPAVAVMTPSAGTQYVGFHAISAATQGNLYVDDLSISTVLATTSETLLRAVTVFPNPSTTGLFDLDIHGANAKGSLEVVVTNTLGQRVHTAAARDNATNRLDLSNLAAGIYHLQVRNGDDFVTRTV